MKKVSCIFLSPCLLAPFLVVVVVTVVVEVVSVGGGFQGYKMIMGLVITLQRLLTREKIGIMFTL